MKPSFRSSPVNRTIVDVDFESKLANVKRGIDAIPQEVNDRLQETLSAVVALEDLLMSEINKQKEMVKESLMLLAECSVERDRCKNLFEKQKDIIRDDRYCECGVCGIKVHDEDATFCEGCDDGLDTATCDTCATLRDDRHLEGDELRCNICDAPIKIKPVSREYKLYV